jgi:hypothetical protein
MFGELHRVLYFSISTIDKCLTRTPDRRVKLLENVYEMVCESKLMYGAEI